MVEVRLSSSLSLTQDFAEERSRFKFGKLELQSIDKVGISIPAINLCCFHVKDKVAQQKNKIKSKTS